MHVGELEEYPHFMLMIICYASLCLFQYIPFIIFVLHISAGAF